MDNKELKLKTWKKLDKKVYDNTIDLVVTTSKKITGAKKPAYIDFLSVYAGMVGSATDFFASGYSTKKHYLSEMAALTDVLNNLNTFF